MAFEISFNVSRTVGLNDAIFASSPHQTHLNILTFTHRADSFPICLISTKIIYTPKTIPALPRICYGWITKKQLKVLWFFFLIFIHCDFLNKMTLRQRFSKDPLKVVRQLDFFPKVPEECQQSTRVGGTRKQNKRFL